MVSWRDRILMLIFVFNMTFYRKTCSVFLGLLFSEEICHNRITAHVHVSTCIHVGLALIIIIHVRICDTLALLRITCNHPFIH